MKKGVYSVLVFNNEQLNSIGGYGMVFIFWDFFVKVDDFIGVIVIVIGIIEEVIV